MELQFPTPLRVVLLCFATQSLQVALEWLRQGCLALRLRACYFRLLQLDIVNRIGVAASQGCDSNLSADFSILALVIFLLNIIFKT